MAAFEIPSRPILVLISLPVEKKLIQFLRRNEITAAWSRECSSFLIKRIPTYYYSCFCCCNTFLNVMPANLFKPATVFFLTQDEQKSVGETTEQKSFKFLWHSLLTDCFVFLFFFLGEG